MPLSFIIINSSFKPNDPSNFQKSASTIYFSFPLKCAQQKTVYPNTCLYLEKRHLFRSLDAFLQPISIWKNISYYSLFLYGLHSKVQMIQSSNENDDYKFESFCGSDLSHFKDRLPKWQLSGTKCISGLWHLFCFSSHAFLLLSYFLPWTIHTYVSLLELISVFSISHVPYFVCNLS